MALCCAQPAAAKHAHKEKEYQKAWCDAHGGVMEYRLPDGARVDCLTNEYAVEFDFAPKWAESIGQALYYGIETGRKPAVVLIMEDPVKDRRYMARLEAVAIRHKLVVMQTSQTKNGQTAR